MNNNSKSQNCEAIDTEKKLSVTLRNLRLEKGLSLREFSGLLGISHAYLNKLEKGIDPRTGKDVTPTIDNVIMFADGLHIPRKEFLEMCGYLDTQLNDSESNSIALEDFKAYSVNLLSNADSVTLKGEIISKEDIRLIINSIKLSIELIAKKGAD